MEQRTTRHDDTQAPQVGRDRGPGAGPRERVDVEPHPAEEVLHLAQLSARRQRYHPGAIGLIAGALLATGAAFLIAQNTQRVAFDWLWVSFDASLWAVLLGSFLAGAVASPLVLVGVMAVQRRRRRFRALLERVGDGEAPDGSAPARGKRRRAASNG